MAKLQDLFAGYPTNSMAEYIAMNEGFGKPGKPGQIYIDTRGKRTVGYGFNIDDPYIRKNIPADVVAGRRPITKEEAMPILNKFIGEAQNGARELVGSDKFDSLSDSQRMALTDFVYNVGKNKASGFKNTLAAIQAGDFNTAAAELLDSDYAKQVGDRAIRNSRLLSSVPAAPKESPSQTFKDAFASARKSGKSVFEFNGKKYSTKVKS